MSTLVEEFRQLMRAADDDELNEILHAIAHEYQARGERDADAVLHHLLSALKENDAARIHRLLYDDVTRGDDNAPGPIVEHITGVRLTGRAASLMRDKYHLN